MGRPSGSIPSIHVHPCKYERTTCVKTIIPTGRDFGLAEWINTESSWWINRTGIFSNTTGSLRVVNQFCYSGRTDTMCKRRCYKTGVINDPLGQLTVPAGSDCYLILKFGDGWTDGHVRVKIVITTGRDCGRPCGSKKN